MFKISQTTFSSDGKTVNYNYEVDRELSKYFNKKESFYITYDRIISGTPESIIVIPLLANIMPISWFLGFDVYVDELDETFYHSLIELKAEFAKHFSAIKEEGTLHVGELIQNKFTTDHTALLFSGGLDSFESLTRNLETDPFLISVLGADIEIADTKRWDEFKRFNEEESVINKEKLCYVTANLRTFYTYEVDLLVEINWWGKIQHGMALIGLIAPLSYLKGIRNIMIASSNTGEVSFGWGSTSETDEKVKWANTKVIHDGFHLRRTEKIEGIVDFAKRSGNYIKLRVCYHDLRKGYNCSRCPKCQRTMFGFILCGENPNDYGFEVPADFYDLVRKNFGENSVMTTGVAYEWKCLQDKAKSAENSFIINNETSEKKYIDTFAALPLESIINKNAEKKAGIKRAKYILISKFPKLFKYYLSLRRKV